ncbi:MAG: small multi-drug export protein [Oscillospiraceae bacterium]|jgi:uncharacterized membrane protein|nr:small multi-drug export protein [Oscillospiraceae bacterium]
MLLLTTITEHFFEAVRRYLIVFGVAMLPVIELRGAIPLGIKLGLTYRETIVCAILGNLVPIPLGIVFLRRVLEFLSTKSLFIKKLVDRKVDKSLEKHDAAKYASAFIALAVLVAIPLPGTGAWTGALICAFMGVKVREGFPPIALGIVGAGVIVTVITFGAVKVFS